MLGHYPKQVRTNGIHLERCNLFKIGIKYENKMAGRHWNTIWHVRNRFKMMVYHINCFSFTLVWFKKRFFDCGKMLWDMKVVVVAQKTERYQQKEVTFINSGKETWRISNNISIRSISNLESAWPFHSK